MFKSLLISLLIILSSCSTNKVCRSPSGKEVDWYTIFFMPQSVSTDGAIHYAYYDPSLSSLEYYKYDEGTFPPTRITKYVTGGGSDYNYFFWNDDKTVKGGQSDSASSSKAHAKGSLVYDSKFGAFYGQTFLCISVTKANAEAIAKLLSCVNVSINKSVSSDRVNSSPNVWVQNLIKNKFDSSACALQHTVKIRSKGGEEFTFFGKNYLKKIIPYDTTLRTTYKDHFYVRTWSRPALAPAQYDTYNLVNVLQVKYGSFSYGVNKEHAKWAIAKNQNIVCFADLNHTDSQKDRGGHIVCFKNAKLHSIMKGAIVSTDGNIGLQSTNPFYELFSAKNNVRVN